MFASLNHIYSKAKASHAIEGTRHVAIKRIFNAFANKVDAKRTYREIMYLLHLCDHPNIVKLHDVIPSKNDLDVYLVMEEFDTDLSQVISSMYFNQRTFLRHNFRRAAANSYSVYYMAVVEGAQIYSFSESSPP